MGVADWFQTFCNEIKLSNEKVEIIRRRYRAITEELNRTYWNSTSNVLNSIYVGSYGRRTDTRTSDVDIIVSLPFEMLERFDGHLQNGQSALLQAVKNTMLNVHSTTRMKGDGQVVVVEYSDGISFDVVPAFLRDDGGYYHVDTHNGGRWKVTYPKHEIDAINEMNNLNNGNLKRLCRMARMWKDNWNIDMGGLLIDTFAYRFIRDRGDRYTSYASYDLMSRDFFKYLSKLPNTQYALAPGSRSRVYIRDDFKESAHECYELADEAISVGENAPSAAKLKWREIYGSKFPR
ncbi:putative nucleotidyltransferase [Methanococcus maripaludis]|uniref:protein adenylyltransferase n=1 Tax=Methanococcus maripaludis TaxID=39152 RepID=A0A7J9NU38_METMI|nr:nucleotidyltransferase [Methanococcus maripaludis]MBA2850837.1 putative nucleotidyltransferase [Methanococcus maripaludis]